MTPADTLGRDGDDMLDGGAGAERLDGGDGDDTLFNADGRADNVDCGPGTDDAEPEGIDTFTDCEL